MSVHILPAALLLIGGIVGAVGQAVIGFAVIAVAGLLMLIGV